jgi:hypothetical protein
MIELFFVPASESLLAQFHLVAVGFLTFLLDLGIVVIALLATFSSLTDAREEDRREEEGSSGTAASVDCQLGRLWKSLEFLSHRWVRSLGCDNSLVDL